MKYAKQSEVATVCLPLTFEMSRANSFLNAAYFPVLLTQLS